jgi:phage pi2 protein 07
MKQLLIIMLLIMHMIWDVQAQSSIVSKPGLKIENLYNWPKITTNLDISNDGKFVFYNVENETPGKLVMHVSNINKTWERQFIGASQVRFSKNGKYITGLDSANRIFILKLGTQQIEFISNANQIQMFANKRTEYISYINDKNDLLLKDLNSGLMRKYASIERYYISPNNENFVLVTKVQVPDQEKLI